MSFVSAQCPKCGGVSQVDRNLDADICKYCGSPFVVEKAIQNYNIVNHNDIHDSVVNVYDGSSSIEVLLKRASDWKKIGEYWESNKVYAKITKQYPGDYRGWMGLLETGSRSVEMHTLGNSEKCIDFIEKICNPMSQDVYDMISDAIFDAHLNTARKMSWDMWKYAVKYCRRILEEGHREAVLYTKSKNIESLKRALLELPFGGSNGPSNKDDFSIIEVEEENSNIFLPCVINGRYFYKSSQSVSSCDYEYNPTVIFSNQICVQNVQDINDWIKCYETILYRNEKGLCWRCGGKIRLFSKACKNCGEINEENSQWKYNKLQTQLVRF